MIDENVIYREAFKTIACEDFYFDKDTTGREVGEYIAGTFNLASRLLKELDKEDKKEREEESNWGQ